VRGDGTFPRSRAKATALDSSNSINTGVTRNTEEAEVNSSRLASYLHFSQLFGLIFPVAGFIAPLVIWAIYKDSHPTLNTHFRNIVNWIISVLIYLLVCGLLAKSFLAAIGLLGVFVIVLLCVVFALAGGMKAKVGDIWRYPLSLPFLKPTNEPV